MLSRTQVEQARERSNPTEHGTNIPPLKQAWKDVHALAATVEALADSVREVANSGVEHDDERISYLTVQIPRLLWNELRERLAAYEGKP